MSAPAQTNNPHGDVRSSASPVLSSVPHSDGVTHLQSVAGECPLPSQRLFVEDPGEAVFIGSVALDAADPFIQLLVLEHRLVRVETDVCVAGCPCLLFSQCRRAGSGACREGVKFRPSLTHRDRTCRGQASISRRPLMQAKDRTGVEPLRSTATSMTPLLAGTGTAASFRHSGKRTYGHHRTTDDVARTHLPKAGLRDGRSGGVGAPSCSVTRG